MMFTRYLVLNLIYTQKVLKLIDRFLFLCYDNSIKLDDGQKDTKMHKGEVENGSIWIL